MIRQSLTSLSSIPAIGADLIIDVRAPSEFAEDHIPGAVNLPVLSDAERAEVGTIYVQESAFKARKVGAALVAANAARHLQGPLAQMQGDWQPPMNLGSPINTKNDEGALHVQLDGSKAYFARSIATDGNPPVQIDIYEFEMPEAIRPRPATYINVVVLDSKTHQPLKAIVQLVDLDSKITYIKMLTNAEGRVLVCLASGQDYGLHISKDNYAFYSEHFSLLDTNTLLEPKEMIVYLHPIVIDTAIPNEPIVLNNIFFESGSAQLLESSFFELDELAEFLLKQPALHILISGHTDNVGGVDENLVLSQQRAKSIYDYLVGKGVEEERLTFEGRGESEPIASNQTSEGRQKNRRTAFTILNK